MGRLVKKSIAKAGFDEAQLSHRSYRSVSKLSRETYQHVIQYMSQPLQ